MLKYTHKTVLTSVKSDVKGDVKQERGKLWLVVSRHHQGLI